MDLRFELSQTKLSAADGFQALALWWDVEFEGSAETVVLSTAPGAPDTHWHQTVILLPKPAPTVAADGRLQCRVQMRQSDENPRQYDIVLDPAPEQEEHDDEDDDEGAIVDPSREINEQQSAKSALLTALQMSMASSDEQQSKRGKSE
jgi:hypothetical protein